MNKSKIKRKTCVLASILLANHLHAVAPTVTNVVANFNEPGILDITYDLQDPDTGTLYVWFKPSFYPNRQLGVGFYSWENPYMLVTGDVGEGITPGNSKKIRWKIPGWALENAVTSSPTISVYAADSLEAYWDLPSWERRFILLQSQFKITSEHKAETHSAPSGMEYVRFSSVMLDSAAEETYVFTVSPFFVDRADIITRKYNELVNWASSQGYTLTEFDENGWDPADSVWQSWQAAIVWCNARSQKEGLTPVYYTDSSRTAPLQNPTGLETIRQSQCDFKVDGYRIPTPFELMALDQSFIKGGNGTDSYNWFSETPDPLSLRPNDLYRNGPLRIDTERWFTYGAGSFVSSFLARPDSYVRSSVWCGPVRVYDSNPGLFYSTHNPKVWPPNHGSLKTTQSFLFFGEGQNTQIYSGPFRCVRSIPEEAQKAPPSALLK